LVTVSSDFLIGTFGAWVLLSIRVLGCFFSFPPWSYRAFPISQRIVISLAISYFLLLLVDTTKYDPARIEGLLGYVVILEFFIGAAAGWFIRLGMAAFDILAEVIGIQTSLSFAATFYQDPSLASGLPGQLINLIIIALMFALNLHLVFFEILATSYTSFPPGSWPQQWAWPSVVRLASGAFSLGLILSLPVLVVYLLINATQAIIVRVSPQLNLFAVGFAIFIPVAFIVFWAVMPALPSAIETALEPAFRMIRSGLAGP